MSSKVGVDREICVFAGLCVIGMFSDPCNLNHGHQAALLVATEYLGKPTSPATVAERPEMDKLG